MLLRLVVLIQFLQSYGTFKNFIKTLVFYFQLYQYTIQVRRTSVYFKANKAKLNLNQSKVKLAAEIWG